MLSNYFYRSNNHFFFLEDQINMSKKLQKIMITREDYKVSFTLLPNVSLCDLWQFSAIVF